MTGPLCPISVYGSPVALLKFQILNMFSAFLWIKLYFFILMNVEQTVISIDVRHLFFMWSVFAIKHLVYQFVKQLLIISLGLPIWVMAIECPQVMRMAY
jgi:hypothetical protein